MTDPQPGASHTQEIPPSTTPKRLTRKRPHPPFPQHRGSTSVSPFDEAMLQSLQALQQQQQNKAPQDDDEHYLLSFLPVMKSLDTVTKFEFRGELNNMALRYLRRSHQSSPQNQNNDNNISRTPTPTSHYHSSTSTTTGTAHQYRYSQYEPGSQFDPPYSPPGDTDLYNQYQQ